VSTPDGPDVDDAIRTMLLLMPRLVGRVKKHKVPAELQDFTLAPRHLSLLAYLQFEGRLSVNELAARLEVAPATVSLMVGDLSRQGILHRQEDENDRRRTLVTIADEHHHAINQWLGRGARAWRTVLEPLTPDQRKLVIDTLTAYDRAVSG
jgi:DNA-binding MarR family transcriptional regulator